MKRGLKKKENPRGEKRRRQRRKIKLKQMKRVKNEREERTDLLQEMMKRQGRRKRRKRRRQENTFHIDKGEKTGSGADPCKRQDPMTADGKEFSDQAVNRDHVT